MQHDDEAELQRFVQTLGDAGVHIVCAAGPEGAAATALLGKALQRAQIRTAGLTLLSYGERLDSPPMRAWLADAPALLLVGVGPARPTRSDRPQLSIDGSDGEPLAARAFRLGETLAHLGDVSWCAAVGLLGRPLSHLLVERALGRYAATELASIAELLDAAARGPDPAVESLNATEMLIAAPTPRHFLDSVPAEVLRQTQALVRAELMRATRLRPRPGFGVVVVEYESACHLEDLVAERWRGLRPGTVVLVGNHGAADGMVAVTARAAVPEALERLRSALGDEGKTLLDPEIWAELLERLGVAPPAAPELGEVAATGLSALLN